MDVQHQALLHGQCQVCSDRKYRSLVFLSAHSLLSLTRPKGPVPVGALEWRIREDVPTNLRAVKLASENLPWECQQDKEALEALAVSRRQQQERYAMWHVCVVFLFFLSLSSVRLKQNKTQLSRMTVAKDWMEDETLGAYIGDGADDGVSFRGKGLSDGGGATAESNKEFIRVGVGSSSGGPPGGNVNMKAVSARGGFSPSNGSSSSSSSSSSSLPWSANSILERFFTRQGD